MECYAEAISSSGTDSPVFPWDFDWGPPVAVSLTHCAETQLTTGIVPPGLQTAAGNRQVVITAR